MPSLEDPAASKPAFSLKRTLSGTQQTLPPRQSSSTQHSPLRCHPTALSQLEDSRDSYGWHKFGLWCWLVCCLAAGIKSEARASEGREGALKAILRIAKALAHAGQATSYSSQNVLKEATLGYAGHTKGITCLNYSFGEAAGKYLASGAADSTAKIWDAESGELLHTLEGHSKAGSDPGRSSHIPGASLQALRGVYGQAGHQ